MELILSIIVTAQIYVGFRLYKWSKSVIFSLEKKILEIKYHNIDVIDRKIDKVEGEITTHILDLVDNLRKENKEELEELYKNVEIKRIETESGLRDYLNSWRTSEEFIKILHSIERSEDKKTSQNTY